MAGPQPQHWLHNLSKPQQWRHLLRATLRECTYLPDPIARIYMKEHIISRYRAVSSRSPKAGPQAVHAARNALSVLRRANEGYSRPLEKVLLLSYGRTGKRRHELLAKMLKPEIPNDSLALKELLSQPVDFSDGWELPAIVKSLAASQMQNTVVATVRIRPLIKQLEPPIPKQDTWGKEVAQCRKRNIRRKWYNTTLSSLLPPLPEKDLRTLEGLISGTVPWEPVKRRNSKPQIPKTNSGGELFTLLARGPEKGATFAEYAYGRPHTITVRLMRRQWKRLSALVPRQYWNPTSQKWRFLWDSPKEIPKLSFNLESSIDPEAFFKDSLQGKEDDVKAHQPSQ
ncbi:uncharacterized protein N7479_006038 [Penicillium vulpinum]|uniref:LYR motif-containing protein Cup1-like N-terminal domain-containing protein n=1 Tax=Penicillium vulpinum TaxID=29845 RepID=A0A1V6SEI3_9EURO|nr:uncharacterized protein N7479_006038 [Penicillium vulpinum]KAJ5958888.1 hypothetical protein N7479_006038 [Penicillium vulpinum]OQE12412.1 hypothetical protein PENVUL_c001G07413 [Penicillium vulpinum]